MLALISSIVALLLGPLVVVGAGRRQVGVNLIDAFVLVAIGGLVFLHVLPHSIGHGGGWAVLAAVVGLGLPVVGEHALFHGRVRVAGRRILIALALAGLAVHALLDGAALIATELAHDHGGHHHEELLATGVILHRLPIGVAIWAVVRPRAGVAAAAGLITLIALMTVLGFLLGGTGLSELSIVGLSVFQALVAGSLVHVVLAHPLGADADPRGWHLPQLLGVALGVALLLWLGQSHPADRAPAAEGLTVSDTFVALALASAPALVLAFLGAGLLRALMRPAVSAWLARGGRFTQALRGMAFGLPLPICSCGVVPLYRGLVATGAPPTAAFAFLVATPELGLDAFLLSLPLLGTELAVARLVAAAVAAVAVALLVGGLVSRAPAPIAAAPSAETLDPALPLFRRLRAGLRYGLVDLFDDVMPWVLGGLLVAALAQPLLAAEWLAALPAGVDVLVFALLGMPVYVCASGATPIVAILLAKGVSPGAGLAFLLAGPATNLTTFGVVAGAYGRRVGLAFAAAMAGAAVGLGLATNALLPGVSGIDIGDAVTSGPSVLEIGALAVLATLLLAALVRRGPRALVAEVLPVARGHADDLDGAPAEPCCDSACASEGAGGADGTVS